jgi:hypothetical protein
VQPFHEVSIIGKRGNSRITEVNRRIANEYRVEIRYMGKADPSQITLKETKPGVLEINTGSFAGDPRCQDLCLFKDRDLQVFVYAPDSQAITITGDGSAWYAVPEGATTTSTTPSSDTPAMR